MDSESRVLLGSVEPVLDGEASWGETGDQSANAAGAWPGIGGRGVAGEAWSCGWCIQFLTDRPSPRERSTVAAGRGVPA